MTHLPETTTFPAAELDRRFSAFAIDRVVAWGVGAALAYVAWRLTDHFWVALVAFVATSVVAGLVTAILVGATGSTPGKAALGLRIVRASDGRPIGFGAALGRTLALWAAGLPTLGLGLATLAWTAAMDPDRRRRGLHDRIGDAVVVDVRPRPAEVAEDDDRPQQIVNLTAMRLLPSPAPAPVTAPGPSPFAAPAPVMPQAPPPAAVSPAPATAAVASPAAAPVSAPVVSTTGPVPARTQLREPVPGGQAAARWRVSFDTGESFLVQGLALVGRRPEPRANEPVSHVVPLRSSDMSLSKTHAQFQVAPDGALVVMDRGSTNGSFLVRQGVAKPLSPGRPSTLLDGDEVRFGDRTMRVSREG